MFLAVRPVFHRTEARIDAHSFVAFLACGLQVTLKAGLGRLEHGITPGEVIAKFKTMQMVDVHVPTADGSELILSRYTQPGIEPHAARSTRSGITPASCTESCRESDPAGH